MTIKLRKLSHALGAEVCDFNIAAPMSESQFGDVHDAFLKFGCLLFRDQDITREQHIEFSRRFGPLDNHDAFPSDQHPDYPELMVVTNEPQPDGTPSVSRYSGRRWHTDMSHTLVPSLGSLLRCIYIPDCGGDTMFCNTTLAYETLSPAMQQVAGKLHAIHVSGTRKMDHTAADTAHAAEQKRLSPPVAQPVVRVHPDTGRKALYLGEKVSRFDGMTEAESRPLIEFLNRHATRPEFVYRHQWRQHDIVLWDNRCTLHMALGDFDPAQRRRMERTTVMGSPSGYVATQA
jgi:taurine dioxygenase